MILASICLYDINGGVYQGSEVGRAAKLQGGCNLSIPLEDLIEQSGVMEASYEAECEHERHAWTQIRMMVAFQGQSSAAVGSTNLLMELGGLDLITHAHREIALPKASSGKGGGGGVNMSMKHAPHQSPHRHDPAETETRGCP